MKLDPYIRSIAAYESRLVDAINSGKCTVYLDTSTLMWTLQINIRAREQFFEWCRSLGERIRIPVWAAHELHRHLLEDTVIKGINQRSVDCERKLHDFIWLVAERSDDNLARSVGSGSSDTLIAKVQVIRDQIRILLAAIRKNNISSANEEIIEFVNEFILDSDLREISKELSEVGEFRYSHRFPPGFQDRAKPENRYGDLVIWEEILRDCIGGDIGGEEHACIFISQDQKTDWTTTSPLVKSGNELKKQNRDHAIDVPLAHPLLQHEYKKGGGSGSVFVVTPHRLSIIAFRAVKAKPDLSLKVDEWVKISYLSDLFADLVSASIEDKDSNTSSSNDTSPTQAAATRRRTQAFPTVDDVFARPVSARLEKVQGLDHAALAAVLDDWLSEVASGKLQPYILGRLLASTPAQNNLPAVGATLTKARKRVSDEVNARIFFGLGAALYFGSNTTLRAKPSSQVGEVFLELCLEPVFSDSVSKLASALKEAGLAERFIPGSRSKVSFEIEASGSKPKTLNGMRIDGNVVTQTVGDKTGMTIADYIQNKTNTTTAEQLVSLVSRLYIIDPKRMTNPFGKNKFRIRPEMGLVELDFLSPDGFQLPYED